MRWLSVDLPDAIRLRERFFAPTHRFRHIAASALDPVWMDAVDPSSDVFIIVAISASQLAYMLDGIDWRNPQQTWRPTAAWRAWAQLGFASVLAVFYAKWMDGRIDDPNAGWKGRGLWTTNGNRTPFHMETGKGTTPKVVKFQVRPDPLAR
jgi:hypothetical protein